jgi:GNAT superfamily N-acetyltransferase
MSLVEISVAAEGVGDAFLAEHDRAFRSESWGFKVVWHERAYEIVARDGEHIVGAVHATIAASLTQIDKIYVLPSHRRRGIGREMLERLDVLANYYNCHKLTFGVLHNSEAQTFFERCGYHVEAVLLQHTFKLDVALMRKFVL